MSGENVRETVCTCTAVRRASRSITQLYDLVLAPTGLRATQFILLFAIGQDGEIAQCKLAEDYAISIETLSRRLAGLRQKGLIQLRDGSLHHQHVYSLTERGSQIVREAIPYWNRAQERLNLTLGEEERELLLSLCDRLAASARTALRLRLPNRVSSTAFQGSGRARPAVQTIAEDLA